MLWPKRRKTSFDFCVFLNVLPTCEDVCAQSSLQTSSDSLHHFHPTALYSTVTLPASHSSTSMCISLQVWLCWSGGPIRDQHYNLGSVVWAESTAQPQLQNQQAQSHLQVWWLLCGKAGIQSLLFAAGEIRSLSHMNSHSHPQTLLYTQLWFGETSLNILVFFCHVSFRPRTTAALEEKCLSLPLLPPLGNKRERWDDGWRGDKRKGEGKDLVTLSVKCQNVLADCSFLTRPLAAGGEMGDMWGGSLKVCQRNG